MNAGDRKKVMRLRKKERVAIEIKIMKLVHPSNAMTHIIMYSF